MVVLMTGFDPFGGAKINPAWEAVQRVRAPEGVTLVRKEIPTVFRTSGPILTEAVREADPDLILLIGQAAGRDRISVERVAVNLDDARIPDNAGDRPQERKIEETGENAYFARLPVRKTAEAIEKAGIPASVSLSAGSFVCNHLFYVLMHELERTGSRARGGFLHVPAIPEQLGDMPAGTPSMPLSDIVRGLEAALAFLAGDNEGSGPRGGGTAG